ncbi:MAG: periplasmic heavy metal sensor [Desulfomonile tiedjei]|nr:periplasmic heavy metal sensor [Desulfomonile tiedjei]
MKKTAIVLVIGVLAIASATCFHALAAPQGPPPGPPPHGGGFFGGPPGPPPGPPPHGGGFFGLLDGPPDLMEKLKLTDDQLKQMRLAYVDSQDKTRKARNALMGLHDEKKTMLISGKIDQAKLAKLDEETTKLASEVMAEELKMKREQLSKLTPEQVNLLADFLATKKMGHGPKMMSR